MATSADILLALENAVKTIIPANGYQTTLNPANVFSRLSPLNSLQRKSASSYPRVFIISDGAVYGDLPSHRVMKEEQFTVLGVFAQDKTIALPAVDVPLETQVARFVDDFELWLDRNRQCGGSDLVQIISCVTDSETPDTEAIALFEIKVTYKRNLRP